MPRPTFSNACAQYIYRYTMQHIPRWARNKGPDGAPWFYAPQFRTDAEWYASAKFPGESGGPSSRAKYTEPVMPTWPIGQRLVSPFVSQLAGEQPAEWKA